MVSYKKIKFNINKSEHVLDIGLLNSDSELKEMFALRYEIYNKKGYIHKEDYPDKIESDEYDENKRSVYFIAKINNKMVGSLRLIKDYYLPTEKECFNFNEPKKISSISRKNRAEVGRLVSKNYRVNGDFFPRHIVLLGLLSAVSEFALKNNIYGGYAFIKKSLDKKLNKLSIPIKVVRPYEQIYKKRTLEKYFSQKEDPVVPVFFITKEVKEKIDKIFNSKLFFDKCNGENEFLFKKVNIIKLLFFKLFSY